LWTGTAASVVDLHPVGFSRSQGTGVFGGQQVGVGILDLPTGLIRHALLWTGSAQSFVDLHSSGYSFTLALGIFGNQQVGLGKPIGTDGQHALLWTGSATSVVDLHPRGFVDSQASSVSHRRQVGEGSGEDGHIHALLWRGSAASVVDLNVFLPAGFTEAIATGIDTEGDIVGLAGFTATGAIHAFIWRRCEEARRHECPDSERY
jgi:hypothetical protein